jgi:predicted O-linked N-acetylglucosamine transferase (SPINDLY family)
MPDTPLIASLQKITAGEVSVADLIEAANALVAQGRPSEAEQLYRVWIGFNADNPGRFAAYYNCASLPLGPERRASAIEALEKAIEINPDFIPARINLGGQYERAGDPDRAIATWQAALERVTAVTGQAVLHKLTTLKQISRVLIDHQRSAAAEVFLQACLELDPTQRDAVEQYIGLRLAQCRWPVVAPWEGVDRKTLMTRFSPLSMAVFTDDPLLQLACSARYIEQTQGENVADGPSDRRDAPIDLDGRRLRIGYVSSDLRDHAIGYLMAELFELHDKAKVEVFAYYCGPKAEGGINARIRAAVDHWCDLDALSDDEAAARIAADGIDILVDVNGHTKFARTAIFARRPAPVIVNWLGFPGSMGSPFHQYIIADDWIVPPESEIYYAEKVLRLPCYQSNDRKRAIVEERPKRADAGLPEDAFVFCCFNGAQKIGRFTMLRWIEILKRTPNSVLWLLDSDEETNQRLRGFAEGVGIDPSRIVFAQKLANAWHLARYPLADLFLDTAPYGAHTTASDALWMGVPVLTFSGRSFASRVCGSLVRAAGLPELIARDAADFVEKAVALAEDPSAVAALRAKLEANRGACDLFDMDKLVARLEGLYREMAETHARGQTPRPDLDNLAHYLEVGVEFDPEAADPMAVAGYHEAYKAGLKRRHRSFPIRPDRRLWTEADIAAADTAPPAPAKRAKAREPAAEPLKVPA